MFITPHAPTGIRLLISNAPCRYTPDGRNYKKIEMQTRNQEDR